MSILIFEAKSNRKQWRFKLQQAKYRILEVGKNNGLICKAIGWHLVHDKRN